MILHITNDYSGSTVYKNLIKELDILKIPQIIYNPIRTSNRIGKNAVTLTTETSEIVYSLILNNGSDRFLYNKKINKIVNDIEEKINLSDAHFIHAHTWFSDGGAAYELHKKYKIPYIVAIRNTDLNLFFKYMLHLRTYGLEILKNASRIIFIAPVYKERFFKNKRIQVYSESFKSKCQLIPNGIDAFWINNVKDQAVNLHVPVELLYVGNFSTNKNVIRLLKAVDVLNKNELRYKLKIVGKGGKQEKKVLSHIKSQDYFYYMGEVKDKEVLERLFNEADIFTMPSKSETFGLVYIEALSQGIPVLFSENEGIDGVYENVGKAVDPLSIKSIAKGIENIVEDYDKKYFNPRLIVGNHNWRQIAAKYAQIYLKK